MKISSKILARLESIHFMHHLLVGHRCMIFRRMFCDICVIHCVILMFLIIYNDWTRKYLELTLKDSEYRYTSVGKKWNSWYHIKYDNIIMVCKVHSGLLFLSFRWLCTLTTGVWIIVIIILSFCLRLTPVIKKNTHSRCLKISRAYVLKTLDFQMTVKACKQ